MEIKTNYYPCLNWLSVSCWRCCQSAAHRCWWHYYIHEKNLASQGWHLLLGCSDRYYRRVNHKYVYVNMKDSQNSLIGHKKHTMCCHLASVFYCCSHTVTSNHMERNMTLDRALRVTLQSSIINNVLNLMLTPTPSPPPTNVHGAPSLTQHGIDRAAEITSAYYQTWRSGRPTQRG